MLVVRLGNRAKALLRDYPSLLHIADIEHPLPEIVRVFRTVNAVYHEYPEMARSRIGLQLIGQMPIADFFKK